MGFLKQITEKPWLPPEPNDGSELAIDGSGSTANVAPQRIALRLFLLVAFTLFSLFCVAYYVRMELDDWRPLTEPSLVWTNTLIILLGSVAFQTATWAIRNNKDKVSQYMFVAGGVLTLAFLVGQYSAWNELRDAGYYAVVNPANAFFYVLTGVHAAHLLGGLAVWVRTVIRMVYKSQDSKIRLSIELCTTYWHFLALVWLGILWILIST